MVNIWVISDTHFGHYNMVHTFKLADGSPARKFDSVNEMDEYMISNWNQVVRPEDHVWHLGDVTMNPSRNLHQIKRLLGHKRLILGNHDSGKIQEYLAAGFQKIASYRVLDGWIFSHIPIHPESMSSKWKGNVHGHTHQAPAYPPLCRINKETQEVKWQPYINVCVEQTNYYPVALEDIRKLEKG